LLLVPAITGLAVCQSAPAASNGGPPCTTANCNTVTVSIPTPPPRPRAWAGITRVEAISQYEKLILHPGFHLPGLRAVHALCDSFRAWKVWAPRHSPGWYIVDERKGTPAAFVGIEFSGASHRGCSP
jgi:hypothetical protein